MTQHYTWVADNVVLTQAIEAMFRSDFITVDTEFERTTTYWPTLSIMQIACQEDVFVIDALSPNIDLCLLRNVFISNAPKKVFHSGRQDMEIIYKIFGELPPLKATFDTQVMAMSCYFLDFPSYESLCRIILNVNVDKTLRKTKWLKRPLSNAEIAYAVGDVTHLRDIYVHLGEKMAQLNRKEWVMDDMKILLSPETYTSDVESIAAKLNLGRVKNQALLRELIMWRETQAQNLNRPREHVVPNKTLVELACRPPKSIESLEKWPPLPHKIDLKVLFNLFQETPQSKMTPFREIEPKRLSRQQSEMAQNMGKMMRLLAYSICQKNQFSQHLLAPTQRAFEELTLQSDMSPETSFLLSGWRWDIFGQWAARLRAGTLFMGMRESEILIKEE